MRSRWKSGVRQVAVIVMSSTLIFLAFRLSRAGSLTPAAAPAATFNSLGEVFGALASNGFDSSGVTANENGSLLGISKCIINQLTGGTCP